MKRFILKSFLFLLLVSIPLLAPLALPIDAFSMNAAGAMSVQGNHSGPFYPNMKIIRDDKGDLARQTQYAIKKRITWHSDQYGYRNRPSRSQQYDVVIIGDSFTVGYKLDQDEMLSEVLAKKTGLRVNAIAPAGIYKYMDDERFSYYPPKAVIFQVVERNIPSIAKFNITKEQIVKINRPEKIKFLDENDSSLGVAIDRLSKLSVFRYYQATKLDTLFNKKSSKINLGLDDFRYSQVMVNKKHKILFFFDSVKLWNTTDETVRNVTSVLEAYHDYFVRRGTKFIFLPVPDKEHVYYDYLQSDMYLVTEEEEHKIFIKVPPPTYMEEIKSRLERNNISTIDVLDSFMQSREKDNTQLYQLDDTHWNEYGVNITAELIVKELKENGIKLG